MPVFSRYVTAMPLWLCIAESEIRLLRSPWTAAISMSKNKPRCVRKEP